MNRRLTLIALLLSTLCGCDAGTPDAGEHVWKEQTRTLEDARDVERILHETANRAGD